LNSQLVQNRRLNRSTEDQLTDNENVRNQVRLQAAITRANESQEQRNKRPQANALNRGGVGLNFGSGK
jgi:hypothetical protein